MADKLFEAYGIIRADTSKLRGDLNNAKSMATGMLGSFGGMGGIIGNIGALLSIGKAMSMIGNELRLGAEAAKEQANADKQLAAALMGTGHAAGLSAEELMHHAATLQAATGVADDEIERLQARLLNFTNIQGDTFKRATELAIDLSVAMGTDVASAGAILGKALNDPVNGLTALQRVLGKVNEEEKELIKNLVESGRGAEAQERILDLLKKAGIEGRAKAMAQGKEGDLKLMTTQLGEVREETGKGTSAIQRMGLEMAQSFSAGVGVATRSLDDAGNATDDFIQQVTALTVGMAMNWEASWDLIAATGTATMLVLRDAVGGWLMFAVRAFEAFGTAIAKLFSSIPEMMKAGMTGGADAVMKILNPLFAALEKDFDKAMAMSFKQSPESDKAMAEIAIRWAKVWEAAGLSMKDVFKPTAPPTPPGGFARPPRGKQDFNMGDAKNAADKLSGFSAIEEFSKRVQESLLKGDVNQKILGVAQNQENIQKQLLDEARKGNAEAARRPAVPIANP